ncbi:hypothetical protein GCM10023351_19120 [Microbacterium gilvum]|uniref:YdbS-like PH domain-containing protein n=1 Tax=Microbacterium gilvum TaxID=1336204 RepID=A0ABP9A6Q4_9MICO
MSDSPTTPQPDSNPGDEPATPPLTRAAARRAAADPQAPTGSTAPEETARAVPPVPPAPPAPAVPPAAAVPPPAAVPPAPPVPPARSAGILPPAAWPPGEDLWVPPAPATPEPSAPVAAPDVLDAGTYPAIREPRGAGRLSLDGTWHQISPKYVVSQFVQNAIFVAVVLAAAGVFWALVVSEPWVWLVAGAIVLVTVLTMIVLPRQARALGYMLRPDDLVFRKGILWQRMVAVPYGRMQLVDITHGPMDRAFGIAKLKMVTAAATTGVEIPGLSQDAAEALRDTLIEVAETRRTGL